MDNSKVPIDSNNPQNPNSANIKKKQQPNAVPAPNGHAGGIIIGNPHKINVDDNFRVLNLSGRDLRFQWSIVVMNYCNKDVQQASEIYKKLFVNYDEFMYPTNCGTNKLYREAFDHEFGIFITDKKAEIHHPQPNTEGFLVPRNKYLSDYESQILQAIDTHRCVQIVAPTGTGKTVLINRIASKRLCIIVIPFNSQISLYKKIPQPYNPQIFYPFILGQPATPQQMKAQKIATSDFNYVCVKQKEKIPSSQVVKNKEHPVRKPFSKLERNMDFKDVPSEIEIEKIVDPNYLQFDSDNTNVCVWDRFVQKISYLNEDFRNHIIIIDESHLLFTDRSYRKAAVRFVRRIRKFKGKVVLVTATPTWEHKLFRNYPF